MIDKSRPGAAQGSPPEFLPVPRASARHDGWTADRQRRFIEALMNTGSVKSAAHAVNMTPEGAYALRRHPAAASFAAAWEQALAAGIQRLEDHALDRALNGEEVPVYSYGKLVGTRRVHNDRLLMFLLRNRAGERFQASTTGNNAVRQAEMRRLREEWRAEWEAEAPTAAEIGASLNAKLAACRDQLQATQSEKTRALYEAYLASMRADRDKGYGEE